MFFLRLFTILFLVSTVAFAGAQDKEINKIIKLLEYTKGKNAYSGKKFEAGYQTHKLGDKVLVGQRDMSKRFEKIPYDFTNKTVLDIGTNQGGMLFAIADKIKYGIGIDYNSKLVNAANRIKSFSRITNVDFYVFNLDKEPYSVIDNFLGMGKVDICFFLSMCRWVNKWRDVIDYMHGIAEAMLFETNGPEDLQREELEYINKKYKKVIFLSNVSDDDKIANKTRALYLCYKS